MKMMLQPRQQVERLQAVDAESLEKIVVGRQLLARNFEVRGRKIQDFVQCLSAVRIALVILSKRSIHGK